VAAGPVPGHRVHLGHVLIGQHEVVPSPVHVPRDLPITSRRVDRNIQIKIYPMNKGKAPNVLQRF
jgi:hypothetical protein